MFLFLNKWYNQTVINIQEAFYEETKQVTITNSISVPSAVYLSSAISTDGKAEGNSEMAVHLLTLDREMPS